MSETKKEGKHRRRWLKVAGVTAASFLAAVVIFGFGVAIGSGRIAVHLPYTNNQVTRGLPNRLNYASVNQVYQSLKQNYDGQLTQTQLEDGLKHGLAAAANDPYTVYFTAKEAKAFEDQLNNSFSGIGAQLGIDDNGYLQVIAPIDGTPAQKAGIKAKDLIAEINGESTSGMNIDTAVSKIRGPKGTTVKLVIVRGGSQRLDFSIVRDDISIPTVKSKVLDNNIGYIQITTFGNDTNELFDKAVTDLQSKQVKGIVLDLRDNPGGLLDSAVHVSSYWVPSNKLILQEKRGGQVEQSYYGDSSQPVLKGMPTVVLVNGGSASASEITTGALMDNGYAYTIGEKTYGKGVVQQLINFGDGSQLKVTVASWYRPNGQNINKKGITPDKTITLTDADTKAGNDTQLQAAESYLNK